MRDDREEEDVIDQPNENFHCHIKCIVQNQKEANILDFSSSGQNIPGEQIRNLY